MGLVFALIATGFTIGMLYMIFIAPYMLTKGIIMITYGSLDMSDKIKSAIPLYNLFIAEHVYSKEYGGSGTMFVMPIATTLASLAFIFRLVTMFVAPDNFYFAVIGLISFVIFAIFAYGSMCLFVANVISVEPPPRS